MYKNILIPTDGSALAATAVNHGIALAKSLGAKITVMTAVERMPTFSTETVVTADAAEAYAKLSTDAAAKTLDAAAQAAKAAGVACETIRLDQGFPYEAIIKTAEAKGCDLILMASHGRRGISALVLGSETVKVLTHSKIPVLVYR